MCHGGQFVYFGHVEKTLFFFMIIQLFLGKIKVRNIYPHPLPLDMLAPKSSTISVLIRKLLCPRNSDGKDAGLRFLLRVTLKLKPISSILVQ